MSLDICLQFVPPAGRVSELESQLTCLLEANHFLRLDIQTMLGISQVSLTASKHNYELKFQAVEKIRAQINNLELACSTEPSTKNHIWSVDSMGLVNTTKPEDPVRIEIYGVKEWGSQLRIEDFIRKKMNSNANHIITKSMFDDHQKYMYKTANGSVHCNPQYDGNVLTQWRCEILPMTIHRFDFNCGVAFYTDNMIDRLEVEQKIPGNLKRSQGGLN